MWLKLLFDLKWKVFYVDYLSVYRNWILVSNGGSSRFFFIVFIVLGNCNKNGRFYSKWCWLFLLLYVIFF